MSELLPLPPSLRARIHAVVAERARVLARVTPGTRIEEADGMLMIGEPAGLLYVLRTASVLRPPAHLAAAVARAQAFYDELGVSWFLDVPDEYAPPFAEVAEAAGLVPEGPDAGMVLLDHLDEKPLPRGLVIEVVRDADTLAVFSETAGAGFGYSVEVMAALHPPDMLDVPDVTYYLGRLDGIPAATAMRFSSHGITELSRVSTVPACRGQGFGEALTRRATIDGFAEGCAAAFLFATAMGRPVYERIGFRHALDYHGWTNRIAAGAS
jgi:N-acetylglutamate synthase